VALAILVLAAVRAFAGQAVPTDSIDERVRKDVLEGLARELDARYAIPDMGKKLAATIKAKQRAQRLQEHHERTGVRSSSDR